MKVLKFYSPLCGPCKVMDANLKQAGVSYENINIFEDEELASKHNIRAIPTLVKIDDEGNEIERHVGVLNVEQIKEFYGKND